MGHMHGGPPQPGPMPLPGVQNVIAVGSGKGGVGKTTVAVNLAVALGRLGYKVGLLDADIYGPNVPLMMGVNRQPDVLGENRIAPLTNHGVKVISVGFISPGDRPLVWRGPMLHSIIKQFLQQVEWGELDFLIVDLPPGTGDVVISLFQTVPLTGAIVVSEEHLVDCGLGVRVAQVVAETHPAVMEFIGMQNTYAESASPEELLTKYGFTAAKVAEAARRAVTRKR